MRKDSTVEFSYPVNQLYHAPDFRFNHASGNLAVSFKNKEAAYRIFEGTGNIGVIITTNGKTYHWDGDVKTQKNTLNKLQQLKLDNVYAETATK